MIKNNFTKINMRIFKYDKLRAKLVANNKLNEFRKTYSNKYEPKNLNTGKYWDNLLENSVTFKGQSPMTKDKIRWISNQIGHEKISMLDLGIGDAFVEELLKERGIKFHLSGIDISKTALTKAKKNYKGRLINADVLTVKKKFEGEKFDVILAIELLEHISVSKLFYLYKQIHSLLKEDGKFILSIPINEGLHLKSDNPSAHVRDYRFNIIRSELELNGFEIVKTNYLFAFEKYYALKKLLSKILVNRWQPNSLTIVARKV